MSPEMEFAPDDRIDDLCHKLVERLFGIEVAFLSNESTLFDFEGLPNEIPGHKLIPISQVPPDDRQYYEEKMPKISKPESYFVWYPSLTREEEAEMNKAARRNLLTLVEKVCGISFEGFPEEEDLYIWKVADFIRRKQQGGNTL